MKESDYNQYFVRGPKTGETNEFIKRYIACLDHDVVKGSYFFNSTFMGPEYSTGIHSAHSHPYDEILFFQGLDPDNPSDLGWELEIFLGEEFEFHSINQTSLVYIPKGFVHCPIISRMHQPAFHIYCMNGPVLVRNDWDAIIKQEGTFKKQYGKHIFSGPKPGETRPNYKNCTTYIDDDLFKGSFHFSSAFVTGDAVPEEQQPHVHDQDVIMGFYGSNPQDQFNLGAKVEINLGPDLKKYTIDKSTVVFIPAGLPHCISGYTIDRPFIFVESSIGTKLDKTPFIPEQ